MSRSIEVPFTGEKISPDTKGLKGGARAVLAFAALILTASGGAMVASYVQDRAGIDSDDTTAKLEV